MVETVDDTKRKVVLDMFEEGGFNGCYNKHLANKHGPKIPVPEPSTYQHPQHKPNILPTNYYHTVLRSHLRQLRNVSYPF